QLFADGSPADLVERYARTLPLSVICELLGLPPSDRPRFIAWANRVARLTNVISLLRMIRGLSQMKRYLEEHLRLAREHMVGRASSRSLCVSKWRAGASAPTKWCLWSFCYWAPDRKRQPT